MWNKASLLWRVSSSVGSFRIEMYLSPGGKFWSAYFDVEYVIVDGLQLGLGVCSLLRKLQKLLALFVESLQFEKFDLLVFSCKCFAFLDMADFSLQLGVLVQLFMGNFDILVSVLSSSGSR